MSDYTSNDFEMFKAPGMEGPRMNLLEWRLNAIEERLTALEDCVGIDLVPVDGIPSGTINDLVNGAISHCQESAAALVTVAVTATDNRIDAVCKHTELLQNLLRSVQELLLNVDARLEELEAGSNQIDFDCESHSDHHGAISKRLEALETRLPC